MRTMLRSKIHRARVTSVNIDYEGSIAIDQELMRQADILPYEQVQVLNVNNGERFTTYAIQGKRGQIKCMLCSANLKILIRKLHYRKLIFRIIFHIGIFLFFG